MIMDMPFIPGFLILLFIYILITKFYMDIANNIGEHIRMFFVELSKKIKN